MTNKKTAHVKYWVACSGGVDSVVLTHLMYQSNQSFGLLHMNFQLRGKQSDEDEQFVVKLAEQLTVPVLVERIDVNKYKEAHPKTNTQLAARNLRYEWFNDIIRKSGATIALGHHQDDQIETFFQQLERGAGFVGLSSMPIWREGYVRPLLKYSKDDLRKLAINNGWHWREDATNSTSVYQRNWYRNIFLKETIKSHEQRANLLSLIQDLQKLRRWNESWLTLFFQELSKSNTIPWELWNNLPLLLQQHLLHHFNVSPLHLSRITKLKKGIKGTHILVGKWEIWNEGDYFIFIEKNSRQGNQISFKVDEVAIEKWKLDPNKLSIDKNKIKGSLSFRKWKAGDRFRPLGMKNGSKLISDYLIDRKVPAHLKSDVQIVVDDEKVVGVIGFAPSELAKVDQGTESVLVIC